MTLAVKGRAAGPPTPASEQTFGKIQSVALLLDTCFPASLLSESICTFLACTMYHGTPPVADPNLDSSPLYLQGPVTWFKLSRTAQESPDCIPSLNGFWEARGDHRLPEASNRRSCQS